MTDRLFDDEELLAMGQRTVDRLTTAIETGETDEAKKLADRMYNEFLSMHDLYRNWITATLSEIGRRYGDDALEEIMVEGTAAWWTPILKSLPKGQNALRQKIKMFAAGLRGHLQPMSITEDDEKVEIKIKEDNTILKLLLDNNANPNILRTMAYTDYVIGEFIEKNKTKTWFNNSIFVFISDHGINEYKGMYEDPRNAHIPFIIYAPNIITKPKIINEIASQVDVVPTLLHLIGYPESFDLMGSNILADNYNGIACRIVNDYAMWFESNYLYAEIFNQETDLFQYSNLYNPPYSIIQKETDSFRLIQNKFHAYLQSAYTYYKNR